MYLLRNQCCRVFHHATPNLEALVRFIRYDCIDIIHFQHFQFMSNRLLDFPIMVMFLGLLDFRLIAGILYQLIVLHQNFLA